MQNVECQCAPKDCASIITSRCQNCTKEVCCCTTFHQKPRIRKLTRSDDDCCLSEACNEHSNSKPISLPSRTRRQPISEFFGHVKGLYAAALGTEILCIAAAEIGENMGLYVLGFNHIGIPIAYAMGYVLPASRRL